MNYDKVWNFLVDRLRDFYDEAGFPKDKDTRAIIGLSGGLDSVAVAALAADALGGDKVLGVSMPSKFSTDKTGDEAAQIAQALGIQVECVAISDAYELLLGQMTAVNPALFSTWSTTQENLQARIRGTMLMTLSNAYGAPVLNTGNKSEEMVGYFTLYGDSVGAFAPIADVYKTELFELCRWRNSKQHAETGTDFIPEYVINKAPSAELAPDQKDEDSLPPYAVLDPILRIIESHIQSVSRNGSTTIDRAGVLLETLGRYPDDVVDKVISLVCNNGFKRLQTPPYPKIPIDL